MLSRSLQIAAALGALLLVAGLGLASYSSLAKHREVAEQSRALARLRDDNQSLRAAAEAAAKPEEIAALTARAADLEAALAEAQAAHAQTQSTAEDARAEAVELRRELALAEERMRDWTPRCGGRDGRRGRWCAKRAGRAGGVWRGPHRAPDRGASSGAQRTGPADGAIGARAARAAERTIAELSEQVATAADEARRLRNESADRTAATERMRDDLEAALADAAALRTAADSTEAALAELQAEMARREPTDRAAAAVAADLAALKRSAEAAVEEAAGLKVTLAGAEARIAALSADLDSARSELATARQVPASAPAIGRGDPQDTGADGPGVRCAGAAGGRQSAHRSARERAPAVAAQPRPATGAAGAALRRRPPGPPAAGNAGAARETAVGHQPAAGIRRPASEGRFGLRADHQVKAGIERGVGIARPHSGEAVPKHRHILLRRLVGR